MCPRRFHLPHKKAAGQSLPDRFFIHLQLLVTSSPELREPPELRALPELREPPEPPQAPERALRELPSRQASALRPSCSQQLQTTGSRRKAGKE
jgi:hypothetical protein